MRSRPLRTLLVCAATPLAQSITFAAADERLGDLTAAFEVTGDVLARVPGTDTGPYGVSDGVNTSTATRTVSVVDK